MSVGAEPGHLHPDVSERSGYFYFFYDKHHGRGGPEAARWLPELSDEDEFDVFDQAALFEISDEKGNLYGISVGTEPDREVRLLGTLRQQIAKFPRAHAGTPWHGYPLGPLEHKSGLPHPPERALPQDALRKMVEANLLDNTQRKRLLKGRNI
jgi:hypothetical protein